MYADSMKLVTTCAALACAACSDRPAPATDSTTSAPLTVATAGTGAVAVTLLKPKIGMNGEGFFANLTTFEIDWLRDLDATIVLRIPGGGDSKFAHPKPPGGVKPPKGWGLRQSEIDDYYGTYLPGAGESFAATCDGAGPGTCSSNFCNKGLDALQSSYDSDTNKVTEQNACDPATQLDGMATCNYLEKVVLLSKQLDLQIVYVANVRATATEVFNAIDYLMTNGVTVAAVEMGNEVYYPVNYDWDFGCYQSRFTPIVDKIRAKYPTLPITLGSATFNAGEVAPGADSTAWNNALDAYLRGTSNKVLVGGVSYPRIDSVTVHYYLTQDQCPDAWAARPTYSAGDLDDSGYYSDWSAALGALAGCPSYHTAFGGEVGAARAKYPADTKIFVTELNIKYAEDWGDTLVQGAWLFEQLLSVSPDTTLTLVHNAIGNELFGLISMYRNRVDGSDATELDGIPLDTAHNVRRVGYWAFDVAELALARHAVPLPAGPIALGLPGTRSYWFTNLGPGAVVPTVLLEAGSTVTVSTEVVQGSSLYASAGYAAWNAEYAKTAGVAKRDLDTISGTVTGTSNVLPPYSFGVITYTVAKK